MNDLEKSIWKEESDGWFTYYRCKDCGHKEQLVIDKKPLPKVCPNCQKQSVTRKERK